MIEKVDGDYPTMASHTILVGGGRGVSHLGMSMRKHSTPSGALSLADRKAVKKPNAVVDAILRRFPRSQDHLPFRFAKSRAGSPFL